MIREGIGKIIRKSAQSVISINQHNYEEFFLLYVDGELSAADKQAVEQFVKGNPGYAEELEMLQQMRLVGETVVFDDKAILYRNGSTAISLDNYEENFLLYVDNELSADAKEQVETFVLQHPAVQDQFTLLKQTRLVAEAIYFPGKELLYRKEEKKKPVLYMGWQRIAVAAAFIGFAILVWTLFPGENPTTEQTIVKQEPVVIPNTLEQKDVITPAKALAETGIILNNRLVPLRGKNNTQQKNILVDNNKSPDLIARNNIQPQPALGVKENTVIEKTDLIETARPTQDLSVERNSFTSTNIVQPKNNADEITADNFLAQPAVYKELDTDDEKKSLYLGSIEINKDKLRGFFRKAGSIFRSKARQQEEDRTEAGASNTRPSK